MGNTVDKPSNSEVANADDDHSSKHIVVQRTTATTTARRRRDQGQNDEDETDDPFSMFGIYDHDDDDNDEDEDDWYSTSSMGTPAFDPTTTTATSSLAPTLSPETVAITENNHGVLALKQAEQEKKQQQLQQQQQKCLFFLSPWFRPQQSLWLDFTTRNGGAVGDVILEDDSENDNNEEDDENDDDDAATDMDLNSSSDYYCVSSDGRRTRRSWWNDDEDEESSLNDTTTTTTCSPRYYWNQSNNSNNRQNNNNDSNNNSSNNTTDNRSGMLLWTTSRSNNNNNHNNSFTSNNSTTSSSLHQWFVDEMEYTNAELALSAVEPTEASDLSQPRHVWIVTTAALPWMTGTAVNPLLRAASLYQRYHEIVVQQQQQQQQQAAADNKDNNNNKDAGDEQQQDSSFSITLVLPWLCREQDRVALYGDAWKTKTVQDQEDYIRQWLSDRAKLSWDTCQNIGIQWYTAHYSPSLSSIFAVDDVCDACRNVPDKATGRGRPVVVLEEPEHLNCYRAPGKASWGERFCHVIGIVHTNYRAYAQAHASGLVTGPLVGALFASLVRAYCDKVIKLSDVLQSYAPEKQVTCNVHGIRQEFLTVPAPTGNKMYFIGKLLWCKGLDKMLTLQAHYKKATGSHFALHVYGSGPEQEEIAVSCETAKLPVEFMGRVDHAALSSEYKIFVNPSITEVLCTTTAEALAMGKFVIIPHHSSNHFFGQFPNCLQYHSKYEFCVLLRYALTHTPTPLSSTHCQLLTWQAATDRFIKASAVSHRDAARRQRISNKNGGDGERRFAQFHEEVCKGTSGVVVRTILHNGNDPLNIVNDDGNESEEDETTSDIVIDDEATAAATAGLESSPSMALPFTTLSGQWFSKRRQRLQKQQQQGQ